MSVGIVGVSWHGGSFLYRGPVQLCTMGFGSYDESEQGRQELDSEDLDEDEGVATSETDHEGKVDFEIGASNDELLDKLEDIKE